MISVHLKKIAKPITSFLQLLTTVNEFSFKTHCFVYGTRIPEDYLRLQQRLPPDIRNVVHQIEDDYIPENKLQQTIYWRYEDDVIISKIKQKTIVSFKHTGHKILTDAWYTEKRSSEREERSPGLKDIQIEDFKKLFVSPDTIIPSLADLIWLYGKWEDVPGIPGLSGVIEQTASGLPSNTTFVACLSFFNAPPSHYNTIYTALVTSIDQWKSMNQQATEHFQPASLLWRRSIGLSMSLKDFKASIAQRLCKEGKRTAYKRGRLSLELQQQIAKKAKCCRAAILPTSDVRLDSEGHFPHYLDVRVRQRCKLLNCKGFSFILYNWRENAETICTENKFFYACAAKKSENNPCYRDFRESSTAKEQQMVMDVATTMQGMIHMLAALHWRLYVLLLQRTNLKNQIVLLQAELDLAVRRRDFLSADGNEQRQKKKLRDEIDYCKKELRKKEQHMRDSKTYRLSVKSKIELVCRDSPSVANLPMAHSVSGLPRLEEQQPELLKTIVNLAMSTAANKQAPLLMHVEYRVSLPDHDWGIASKQKLIPSVYARCIIKANDMGCAEAVTYSGPTYVTVRSAKHSSSTGSSHAMDFNRLAILDTVKEIMRNKEGRLKPVILVSSDGRPDENPRYVKVISHTVHHFVERDLDAIFIFTNAPGRSVFNRVETRMAPLSRELSGPILPHSSYGTHLDEQGRTTNSDFEKKNFQKAGEVLVEVWNSMVIDHYEVVAEYVQPDDTTERLIPHLPSPQRYSEHV
ncbi:hypothetical protein ILUMI_07821 [Ignelater luminosus]|uniref:Uncharacterized protein n=1 Tax=Ignelater luminosus TaxID=2038154 RepID=A0A8K0D820_IGNLU|nr:hypothetical protein ILUMI_07821 [Ignelater luminosus]